MKIGRDAQTGQFVTVSKKGVVHVDVAALARTKEAVAQIDAAKALGKRLRKKSLVLSRRIAV